MTNIPKPDTRPNNARFSSGPCTKRPGWALNVLTDAPLGRSHRASIGSTKLSQAINLTRQLLQLPQDYRIGIVPASDTGAFEMAMWSMLGARAIDMLAFDSFGAAWVTDVVKQLKLENTRILKAPYGELPDLSSINFENDLVFTWNGTTSGVRVPNADFIPNDRKGLTICDATSAVFAQELDFTKLDVVTFSWQKVLGGEGAHGVIILSPRAVKRLTTYTPPWPLPKIFRLTKNNKLIEGIFNGATINTPSMLCVEDYLDALNWAASLGGLPELIRKADKNAKIIYDFVASSSWLEGLAKNPATYSNTSVCLIISDPDIKALDIDARLTFARGMSNLLEQEGVAFDIGAYRDAPPGLRIWAGATVEASDLIALMPWLEWAFQTQKRTLYS